MKRLTILAAATGLLALAACDDPNSVDDSVETAPPPMEALPAEEQAVDTAAETPAETPPPTDNSTLPTDSRTSEESVRPESETLFY